MSGAAFLMWAWLPGTAAADPGMYSSQGLIGLPVPETTERWQANLSMGLLAAVSESSLSLSGLPFGLTMGVTDRLALGVHVEPIDSSLAVSRRSGSSVSARLRLLDPPARHPALAIDTKTGFFTQNPTVEVDVITGIRLGRVSPAAFLGSMWTDRGGYGVAAGIGTSVRVRGPVEALAEHRLQVDQRGVSDWAARGGFRGPVGPLLLTAWAGLGGFEEVPWIGGGLVLGLTSVDVRFADRDHDGVTDLVDPCRYQREDLDGWLDDDGCPDPDNDDDGIPDEVDETPNGEIAVEEQEVRFSHPTPRMLMTVESTSMPGPASQASRRKRRHSTPDPPTGDETGGDAP